MSSLVQYSIDALNLGCLYALYALGVAMVFGILRLVNFAHSSLIMIGGYTLVLTAGLPLPLRVALTVAACVAAAVLLELVAFRAVRGANPATLLVTSFAVTIAMSSLAEAVFGTLPASADVHPALRESFSFGTVYVPTLNIATVVVTALLVGVLSLFLTRTTVGLQMRAAAADLTTARLMGVRTNRVISVAFAISGVLAAAAALFLLAASGSVTPGFGVDAVLFGLIAAVVGGLSSLRGAAIGGLVLGVAGQLLQSFLPLEVKPFRDAILFAAVAALLVLRPQGLVAKSEGVRI
ncbi:branched-chain amino acid ABC transporter permease [Pseudonocardia sp. H11422]|uniref:branched-chain amino acid ABC transporter permease n=1 Tax=Pseudonocardia sp. H11422 TaxID=2835866 RepID=UPI001BDCEEBC|nr:branched-chain amino acid ABC transporter permease [Pseudonocardia sp. H11422]